jgi:protein disulfide-isomerase
MARTTRLANIKNWQKCKTTGDSMNKRLLAGLVVMIMIAFSVKAYADGWETDFSKASANAGKSGLYILLDFSGSDWCVWCKKIDAEFFSTGEFKKFAKENLICVSVDFPRQQKQSKELKEQNDGLAKKYNVHGYPTIIILSPEGDFVGKTGYKKIEAKKFVENLKKMIDEHKQNQSLKEAQKKSLFDKSDAGGGN